MVIKLLLMLIRLMHAIMHTGNAEYCCWHDSLASWAKMCCDAYGVNLASCRALVCWWDHWLLRVSGPASCGTTGWRRPGASCDCNAAMPGARTNSKLCTTVAQALASQELSEVGSALVDASCTTITDRHGMLWPCQRAPLEIYVRQANTS